MDPGSSLEKLSRTPADPHRHLLLSLPPLEDPAVVAKDLTFVIWMDRDSSSMEHFMDLIICVVGPTGHQLPIRHWIRHLDRIVVAVRPELPGPHLFSITYRTLDIVGSPTLLDVSKDYRHAIQHPLFIVDVEHTGFHHWMYFRRPWALSYNTSNDEVRTVFICLPFCLYTTDV
jgi:hypothetical protein